MGDEFDYSPLPTLRSIRLVDLQSSSDDSQISCSLFTTELDGAPAYDALSYTWGNPASPYIGQDQEIYNGDASDAIYCNSKSFLVGRNLRDALTMLQAVDFSSLSTQRSKYLWIDAICINQSDLDERASQVRQMDQIFRRAEKVIAWVGPEDEATADAFAVIDNLSTIPRDKYRSVSPDDLWRPEVYTSKLGISPLAPRNWLAWVNFLHRSFFSRIWIVQEMVLAKEIVLVCGSKVFHWEAIGSSLRFLSRSGWITRLSTEQMRGADMLPNDPGVFTSMVEKKVEYGHCAWQLFHARNSVLETGKEWGSLQLLSNHRKCQCKDPRDMIYGLVGLARKGYRPFDTQPQLLAIDYRISSRQLYTRIAPSILRAWGDLSFLAQKEGKLSTLTQETRITALPSWVPNHSAALVPRPLEKNAPDCNWNACGSLKWRLDERDPDSGLLDVQGILIGQIQAMSLDPVLYEGRDDEVWISIGEIANNIAIDAHTQYILKKVPYVRPMQK